MERNNALELEMKRSDVEKKDLKETIDELERFKNRVKSAFEFPA